MILHCFIIFQDVLTRNGLEAYSHAGNENRPFGVVGNKIGLFGVAGNENGPYSHAGNEIGPFGVAGSDQVENPP